MAAVERTGGPALGDFLAALHDRWRVLSREDLLAVLLGRAQRLPVGNRQASLDIFPDPASGPIEGAGMSKADLLADVDAFAARVAVGEYADDDEGYYRDRLGWVDEEASAWIPHAEALFAAVGEVFVAGDLQTARAAYERLLASFDIEGDDGWSLDLWRLEATDVPETLARYLRCVYETITVGGRAAAVHRAYLELPGYRVPTLAELSTTRLEPLPDLDGFLSGWIECLLAETGRPPLRERVRLLVEAATLGSGVDGLAALARRPGDHQVAVGLARIEALAAAGRLDDGRVAALEALALPDAEPRQHAEVADRLGDLDGRLGDPGAALQARRRAWTTEPTRRRLLALAGSGLNAGVLPETLAAEADALAAPGIAGTDRLGCELLLLAGRVDQAVAALTGSEPLGWHRASHPGPVVLPFLWAAVLGTAPAAEAGHLGRMFAAIDDDPDAVTRFADWSLLDDGANVRSHRSALVGPALTALLADVVRSLRADAECHDRWMATASAVAEARIGAIVSGKHRGAYARAASLAYAHAEALAGIDRMAEAGSYLAGVRARFPRHVAFRGELDAAGTTSSLRSRLRGQGS